MMRLFWGVLLCVGLAHAVSTAHATSVRTEKTCPHETKETCRWQIDITSQQTSGGPQVKVRWEKSIVSRHRQSPLSKPLRCNVDRDFNAAAGGYIRVWFQGEKSYCDPMQRNPMDCGVRFQLEDPNDPHSASGFDVMPPVGKKLSKVEHYSTLSLQCGDFERPDYDEHSWNQILGWSSRLKGDGTYVR